MKLTSAAVSLVVLSFFTTFSANAALTDFVGCFDVAVFNGVPREELPITSPLEVIPRGVFYLSPIEESLETLQFQLAEKANNGFNVFSIHEVILQGAKIEESENKIEISFSGEVYNTRTKAKEFVQQSATIERDGNFFKMNMNSTRGVIFEMTKVSQCKGPWSTPQFKE